MSFLSFGVILKLKISIFFSHLPVILLFSLIFLLTYFLQVRNDDFLIFFLLLFNKVVLSLKFRFYFIFMLSSFYKCLVYRRFCYNMMSFVVLLQRFIRISVI